MGPDSASTTKSREACQGSTCGWLKAKWFLGRGWQNEVTRPEESHTQKVFDLDAGAWRSFRYDRLKKVTATMSFE
jgi:hypothetical protein